MDSAVNISITVSSSIATLFIVSLGLAVIFGMMRIINLAHGEFLMIGAFTVVELVRRDVMPVWGAILVAPLVAGAIGAVVEVVLIRPLYGRRLLDTLLVTFGLSLVLFQIAVNIFGTTPPGISTPLGHFNVGRFSQSDYTLVMIGFAVALAVIVYLVFTKTRYGVLARATTQNPAMAAALGVNARRINFITFTLGCALAGIAGGMIAPTVGVSPTLGQAYIAQSFMTVVTAGPAFLLGTVASSTLLGGVANLVSQLFSTFYGQAALLGAAILLLRFMPQGLSGRWKRQL
ncbi:MAG: Branched-chain amino acid ABC-type transport system, permease component [Thermoleophilia bacterium]|nr:Branched-chain amino acid ABC-type transport system, permease component [Thermoleophilia bacterium]